MRWEDAEGIGEQSVCDAYGANFERLSGAEEALRPDKLLDRQPEYQCVPVGSDYAPPLTTIVAQVVAANLILYIDVCTYCQNKNMMMANISSPVSTLIDRFRPLHGVVRPPVRANSTAARKYLN